MSKKINPITNSEFKSIHRRLESRLDRDIKQEIFGASVGYTGPMVSKFSNSSSVPITLSQLMRFIDKADDKTVKEILGL